MKLSLPLLSMGVAHGARVLPETIPYGIDMIQANELEMGPEPPLICIVDSGIDLDHPEFNQEMISGADNDNRFWMSPIEWDQDVSGHGTRMAGIIAAIGGNDIGIKGVGNFPLFITRGLDDEGAAYASDIKKAVEQCVAAGSKIVLLGLGGDFDPRHSEFYSNIVQDGVLVIAAAGNDEEALPAYPARYESVVAVGGVDENGAPWGGSAQKVELVGPAEQVESIYPVVETEVVAETTEELSVHAKNGTGSAAAYVAAAAGLVWSHFPECSNQQIRAALHKTAYNYNDMANAVDVAPRGVELESPDDAELGHGLPQVFDAYYALKTFGCDLEGIDNVAPEGPSLDVPSSSMEESEDPSMEEEGFDELTKALEGDDGLSGGAIGGIIAFVAFVVIIVGVLTWQCTRDRAATAAAAIDEDVKDEDDAATVDEEEAQP